MLPWAGAGVKHPLHAPGRDRVVRTPAPRQAGRAGRTAYLVLMYFSRRMCAGDSPKPRNASKQASTMSGLPHR